MWISWLSGMCPSRDNISAIMLCMPLYVVNIRLCHVLSSFLLTAKRLHRGQVGLY